LVASSTSSSSSYLLSPLQDNTKKLSTTIIAATSISSSSHLAQQNQEKDQAIAEEREEVKVHDLEDWFQSIQSKVTIIKKQRKRKVDTIQTETTATTTTSTPANITKITIDDEKEPSMKIPKTICLDSSYGIWPLGYCIGRTDCVDLLSIQMVSNDEDQI
jgi:hypothetical protein